MLTRQGVTAWRHTLAEIVPTIPDAKPTAAPASVPPGPIAAELVNALAAVALAGA